MNNSEEKMDNVEISEEQMSNEEAQATENIEVLKSKDSEEVDYKAKYFYMAAEMDNLRKRLEREKSQVIKFGTEGILSDLVQVVDTFELTLKAVRNVEDEQVKNIVVGLDMVNNQFLSTLKNHGLEKIETKEGVDFDPNFHEAIGQEEGKKENKIIRQEQSGYILNGRVLRASKVIVSK